MKNTTITTLAALMFSSAGAFAQDTPPPSAFTTPVGFVTVDYGVGFSYIGLNLHEQIQIASTISSASGNVITVADGGASNLISGVKYILEITSGDSAGMIQELTAFDEGANTLTTSDDISAAIVSGDAYQIRPAATIESVFGANNEAGITPGGNIASSTQIWVPTGTGFARYRYHSFFGTNEWRSFDEDGVEVAVNPADVPLIYTDGMVVFSANAGSFVLTGAVKTAPTTIAVVGNFNFVGNAYPVGTTLESTFGANNESGLDSGGNAASSDQILVPQSTGGFKNYFYFSFFGTNEWRIINDDDTTTAIDPSTVELTSGYVLLNNSGDNNIETVAPDFYSNL